MPKDYRDLIRRYAAALLLVAIGLGARLAIDPVLGDRSPFLIFTLVVLIAGVLFGTGPAIAATVASTLLGIWFLLPPRGAFLPLTLDEWTNILAFVLISGAIVLVAHQLVRGRRKVEAVQKARDTSVAREQRLIDAAQDYAIYELDREGRILTWNKGAERLKGWKAEEIIGKPYHILHTPESRAKNAPGRELQIAAETGRFEEEAPRMRKDGTVFAAHVNLFPLRDESGEVTGFVKITRDISERSKAGRAILENRQRLEGVVNSAMDAIITIDEEQRVVLFNPAAERMFGCSAEDALGKSVSHFIPERFRSGHDEHIRRFRETGVTNRRMGALGAISGLRASGEEFPIEASISQVTVGGERLSTVILRDITERKTSEEARTLLAREVDHRAKNALAVAQALVSLTRADTVEEYVEAIRGRIAALARAHSLLSQSQWRGAPLEQLIRDELLPYAREDQLVLKGPAVTTSASAVQSLSLLIHELATNAVKHGALGSERGRIAVEWRLGARHLKIKWSESDGPNVSPPEQEGFGTRLLNQVAGRQLDAELSFDWDPGGLKAEIKLPSELFLLGLPVKSRGSVEAEESPHVPGQENRGRVLIVEDEELVALELGSELSRFGWSTLGPAGSLAEAESLLSEKFDVAVLDVNLGGQSVYPIAEALQRLRVPFLFCTGYETLDMNGQFASVPVIRKPANPKSVSAALWDLLAAREDK